MKDRLFRMMHVAMVEDLSGCIVFAYGIGYSGAPWFEWLCLIGYLYFGFMLVWNARTYVRLRQCSPEVWYLVELAQAGKMSTNLPPSIQS